MTFAEVSFEALQATDKSWKLWTKCSMFFYHGYRYLNCSLCCFTIKLLKYFREKGLVILCGSLTVVWHHWKVGDVSLTNSKWVSVTRRAIIHTKSVINSTLWCGYSTNLKLYLLLKKLSENFLVIQQIPIEKANLATELDMTKLRQVAQISCDFYALKSPLWRFWLSHFILISDTHLETWLELTSTSLSSCKTSDTTRMAEL